MLEDMKTKNEPASRARVCALCAYASPARGWSETLPLRARACKICPLFAHLMALDRRVEKW